MSADSTTPDSPPPAPHAIRLRWCASCREPMRRYRLKGYYNQRIDIDLCKPCGLIWFDETESVRLASSSLAELIVIIQEALAQHSTQPLPTRLACLRCDQPTQRVFNTSRHGRYAQLKCPEGHGYWISFNLFLAEKGYFRSYTWADIEAMKKAGKTLQCQHCGAPLEMKPQSACPHCQSPLGSIDLERLAQSIDQDRAAPPLASAAVLASGQGSCDACGCAVDYRQHHHCPSCHAPLKPVNLSAAASRAAELRPTLLAHEKQALPEVSKRKLQNLQIAEASFAHDVRNGGLETRDWWRNTKIVLLLLPTVVAVVYLLLSPQRDDGIDAYASAQRAERDGQLASIPHDKPGVTPQWFSARREGTLLYLTLVDDRPFVIHEDLQHNVRQLYVDVDVGLARPRAWGLVDMWEACPMEIDAARSPSSAQGFVKQGNTVVFKPSTQCNERLLKDGEPEYVVKSANPTRTLFQSKSAFYR